MDLAVGAVSRDLRVCGEARKLAGPIGKMIMAKRSTKSPGDSWTRTQVAHKKAIFLAFGAEDCARHSILSVYIVVMIALHGSPPR